MNLQRAMGLLLHPTSLPGRYGIGEINEMAYRWVDTLVRARQRIWQILPLGPTGFGDSPYQTHSAFAGNPLLIDLESLANRGYIAPEALANAPDFPSHEVDYGGVIAWKKPLLREAFDCTITRSSWRSKAILAAVRGTSGLWKSAAASLKRCCITACGWRAISWRTNSSNISSSANGRH